MIPSSATILVEANSKAITAVKFAPLRNTERVIATAAYEHEEEAAPRPRAYQIVRGLSSGRSLLLSFFACTIPEMENPSASAQTRSGLGERWRAD